MYIKGEISYSNLTIIKAHTLIRCDDQPIINSQTQYGIILISYKLIIVIYYMNERQVSGFGNEI